MKTKINIRKLSALFGAFLWQRKTVEANSQNANQNFLTVINTEKEEFKLQYGSFEYPDPEMLPKQYDPKKDGNKKNCNRNTPEYLKNRVGICENPENRVAIIQIYKTMGFTSNQEKILKGADYSQSQSDFNKWMKGESLRWRFYNLEHQPANLER